ncbi:MAG TPA: M20/M25/M40 family metallo-hydrolase [Candidatus Marinimicrobia bacterium]|nr:M20/M25/M40 family metallo-hydrolase [Candidatus Neomarinimicrobiota bacterium]
MRYNRLILTFLIAIVPVLVFSQQPSKQELRKQVREYRITHEQELFDELVEWLYIPNVADDQPNIRKCAVWLKSAMERRGITAKILETGGSPVVYGELNVPGANRTIMFYSHYDGQPVDPTKWIDMEPFTPTMRPGKMEAGSTEPKPIPLPKKGEKINEEYRLYARSASDDKSPITALLAAIDAVKAAGLSFGANVRFIYEGEEEAGSPFLQSFAEKNRSLFETEVLYVCDGPMYFSNQPTLKFGARGITTIDITVYGPNVNVHSGHYGNWAPNPGIKLARLLTSMKHENGNVKVRGFYNTVTPLSRREKEALKTIPSYDEELKQLYGFAQPEGRGETLMERINLPSLNIRGLESAWVGPQARTVVPAEATAAIDIRMVKGNDPDDMVNKVIEHVKREGFHVVSENPDQNTRMQYADIVKIVKRGGYPASRTSMDLEISQLTIEALSDYHDEPVVLVPTSGGSVPLYIFTQILDVPTISVPIVNHDNNQHQPNENIRMGHYWQGIETLAALLVYVK